VPVAHAADGTAAAAVALAAAAEPPVTGATCNSPTTQSQRSSNPYLLPAVPKTAHELPLTDN
jgi:hypothetical protein